MMTNNTRQRVKTIKSQRATARQLETFSMLKRVTWDKDYISARKYIGAIKEDLKSDAAKIL